MFTTFIAFALSLPPQAPPLATVAQAPPIRTCDCWTGAPCLCQGNCTCPPASYNKAAPYARMHGKTLVVFVGMKSRPVPGCVVCESSACFNDARPRIIVATPAGSQLHWQADLQPGASDGEIRAAATVKQSLTVQPAVYGPQPFQSYFQQPMRMSFGGFGGGGRGGSSC